MNHADGWLALRAERQGVRGVHGDAVPGAPGRHAAPDAGAPAVRKVPILRCSDSLTYRHACAELHVTSLHAMLG